MLFALVVLGPGLSRAQAITERSLSGMQYFAVHNAFQRSIPDLLFWTGSENVIDLTEQVDRYNVWHMELDVYWRYYDIFPVALPPAERYLEVGHTCIDNRGRRPLAVYLQQLAVSRRATEGFFIVTFQPTPNNDLGSESCLLILGGYSLPGAISTDDLLTRVNSEILSDFPSSAIYTAADFIADGREWPSPQELIARGKHVAFYTDATPPQGSVFLANSPLPQVSSGFWKIDAADADIAAAGWDPNDRGIYRVPENEMEIAANWETAMTNCVQRPALPPFTGLEDYCMTFVGTTKMEDHLDDERFHPPLPMYISTIPSSTMAAGRGTFLEPYRGSSPEAALIEGLDRIAGFEAAMKKKSTITIKLGAGVYDYSTLTTAPIDQAVTLTRDPATPGAVELR